MYFTFLNWAIINTSKTSFKDLYALYQHVCVCLLLKIAQYSYMHIKSPYRVWILHQIKHQRCDLAYFTKQIHYDRNNSLSSAEACKCIYFRLCFYAPCWWQMVISSRLTWSFSCHSKQWLRREAKYEINNVRTALPPSPWHGASFIQLSQYVNIHWRRWKRNVSFEKMHTKSMGIDSSNSN